jgi:hypothetical protein
VDHSGNVQIYDFSKLSDAELEQLEKDRVRAKYALLCETQKWALPPKPKFLLHLGIRAKSLAGPGNCGNRGASRARALIQIADAKPMKAQARSRSTPIARAH